MSPTYTLLPFILQMLVLFTLSEAGSKHTYIGDICGGETFSQQTVRTATSGTIKSRGFPAYNSKLKLNCSLSLSGLRKNDLVTVRNLYLDFRSLDNKCLVDFVRFGKTLSQCFAEDIHLVNYNLVNEKETALLHFISIETIESATTLSTAAEGFLISYKVIDEDDIKPFGSQNETFQPLPSGVIASPGFLQSVGYAGETVYSLTLQENGVTFLCVIHWGLLRGKSYVKFAGLMYNRRAESQCATSNKSTEIIFMPGERAGLLQHNDTFLLSYESGLDVASDFCSIKLINIASKGLLYTEKYPRYYEDKVDKSCSIQLLLASPERLKFTFEDFFIENANGISDTLTIGDVQFSRSGTAQNPCSGHPSMRCSNNEYVVVVTKSITITFDRFQLYDGNVVKPAFILRYAVLPDYAWIAGIVVVLLLIGLAGGGVILWKKKKEVIMEHLRNLTGTTTQPVEFAFAKQTTTSRIPKHLSSPSQSPSQTPKHLTPPQTPKHLTPPQTPKHLTPPQTPKHLTPPQTPKHLTPSQTPGHFTFTLRKIHSALKEKL